MKILSIETSCDDTCISVLEAKGGVRNASFEVLANVSNSQTKVHLPYGGVYPVLAKREHAKNLPILLEQALKQASTNDRSLRQDLRRKKVSARQAGSAKEKSPIDAIAVTYGPGLEMCLWEGITFTKNLAKKWKVPLIPTNHMEGHIVSVFGKDKGKFNIPLLRSSYDGQTKIKLPVLSLLVSGGHTQLILMKKWMQYEIIGETLDDAVGEAFDKVARMLDLPYPGGPAISRLAEKLRVQKYKTEIKFPRPMIKTKDFNFSFSGLKTSVLYFLQKNKDFDKSQIALEFENAAIECLVHKTQKAIEKYKIKTLIVAGGVSANKHLRNEISALSESASSGERIEVLFPTKELATDNSLMIGIAGYLNYIKNKKRVPKPENIKATGNLKL